MSSQILSGTTNLVMRRANEPDLAKIVDLVSAFYSEEQQADERAITAGREKLERGILKKLQEKERNFYFLAYKSEELVGLIQLFVISERLAEFILVYVVPQFRGRGFGEFLVSWGLDELRKKGISFVRTEFRDNNAASRRIFSRFNPVPYSQIYTISLE